MDYPAADTPLTSGDPRPPQTTCQRQSWTFKQGSSAGHSYSIPSLNHDLHRYTSSGRPNPFSADIATIQSERHSPDSQPWHAHSTAGSEQSALEKPSLPSLNLPPISTGTTSALLCQSSTAYRSVGPSSTQPRSMYLPSVPYPQTRSTTPMAISNGSRSPLYSSTMMTSPTSAGPFHSQVRPLGVRDSRIRKAPVKSKTSQNRQRIGFDGQDFCEIRGPSPYSMTGSLDSETSYTEGRLDNRKAGKERNAREDIRTQMEKHHQELLKAGPDYQPVTRLNKHNMGVARIPCKKEEVLDLSYKLHQVRKTEIMRLREALQKIASGLDHISPDNVHELQAIASNALSQGGTVASDIYHPNTPEATPSPDNSLQFLRLGNLQ